MFGIFPLYAQKASIDASINQNRGWVGHQIEGTITVTHDAKDTVDEKSFQLEGQPLTVHRIQEVPMTIGNQNTVVSVYGFELPPQKSGLYVINPVSVTIGGNVYRSLRASYEILDTPKPEVEVAKQLPTVQTEEQVQGIIFRLERFVEGPEPVFPGQRLKFIYRITFNYSIDLTASTFTLFDVGDNFKRIGDVHFKDYQKDNLTVQEITLEVEAYKTGTFHFGPSSIEGRAYVIDSAQQKVYAANQLHAEAPEIDVVVKSFPIEDKPASFTGTLATKLDAQLSLKTPSKVRVGDSIELELIVTGPTNLADMTLPDFSCQPFFSGFFKLDDLPPLAKIVGDSKHFIIDMRAISLLVKAIPMIEISAYDAEGQKFIIWRSEPIPIEISSDVKEEEVLIRPILPTDKEIATLVEKSNVGVPPIKDFETIEVKASDLSIHWMQTFWVLLIVPCGMGLLFGEWKWKQRRMIARLRVRIKTSQEVLEEALESREDGVVISGIREALEMRLQEEGVEKDNEKVKAFMDKLDALKYGKGQEIDLKVIKEEAVLVYKGL